MVATEGLREMEGSALRRLVGRDEAGAGGAARCLVLDCRPFLAHSAGHIRGALNVRCNTIVRRRAKGAVSLEQILPAEGEVRARLRAGLYAAVVVYDERSPRAEALREDSTVALVVRALRRDTARADIRLLAGTGGRGGRRRLPPPGNGAPGSPRPGQGAAFSRPRPSLKSAGIGGYERFSSEYPEFCAKTKSLSNVSPPTSAEPLDLGCSSCGTPFHDQGGPVEILPFLYLGSAYHAARRDMLDALGITALLNVSSDCPNHFEGHYQYKCIPVEDNHKADISSWFMEAIEFIDSVKECCGRVLVHCQAGISRSATICLAYLMMKKRVKLEEAFEFVKQRRSIISPNFSFMGQLLQFESQVLATSYAVEAVSPSGTLRERGKATSTPTSQFVFSFPVSVGVHATPSSLPYLHSPITTSPSC
uniref:dual specificity protein phosphatase 4 isoform X1 n=1 Tax=Agelaius phoeniceus TaxID=39638 RepID=UPI0023EE0261|nr:dual specificity protein phosphatase 4 isoform X1 [Agelaius phoeniceus]